MPRLAPLLFQQAHIGDGHASVRGFAHIVDGEQGDLHGRQGLNKINNLANSGF